LVVSGINHGPNLGWDVHYSGTVSAALEAVMIGYRALAVSVATWEPDVHWDAAADIAARIAQQMMASPLPPQTILNVNVPNLPASEIQGIRITYQGARQYVDRIEPRTDPIGRPYYWLGGSLADEARGAADDTDVRVVADGFVSVTPIQLDMTAHALLPTLQAWDL